MPQLFEGWILPSPGWLDYFWWRYPTFELLRPGIKNRLLPTTLCSGRPWDGLCPVRGDGCRIFYSSYYGNLIRLQLCYSDSFAAWWVRRTWNPVIPSSSPVLTCRSWICSWPSGFEIRWSRVQVPLWPAPVGFIPSQLLCCACTYFFSCSKGGYRYSADKSLSSR